jgi:hypothetical protein
MKEYNYADELTRDSNFQTTTRRMNEDPKEKIVNEQDEDIILNFEDDKNLADEKLQGFEEGVKNDSLIPEEDNAGTDKDKV